MENKEDTEIVAKETQDYASPNHHENMGDDQQQDEVVQKSTDVSMEDDARSEDTAEDLDLQSKEGSPNISSSSDLVSGTPQKHNSRRQSFITLEKYSEGKPASPGIVSTFTGPLIKTTSSQECCNINDNCSSQVSQTLTDPICQDSLSTNVGKVHSQSPEKNDFECLRRPKESLKCEPVRLADKMPTKATEDDDIIPDTQTEVEEKGKKLKPLSQKEEESQQTLDCSQSSDTQTSSGEPRRSGRYKVRPLLSGEDAEEQAEKSIQIKRRRSGEEPKSISPKSSLAQSRPNTRRSQASEEENSKNRLRVRTQRDQSESSQTNSQGRARKKIKLFNSSQEFLDKPEPRRRSTRESSQTDSQSNTPCDDESLSQGRRRRSKVSLEPKEEGEMKKKVYKGTSSQESSQNATLQLVEQTKKDDDEPLKDSQIITDPLQTNGKSQEFECVEQTEKDGEISQEDSQMITCSSHTGGQSQQFDCTENTKKEDSQIVTFTPNRNLSLDRTSPTNKSTDESGVSDAHKNIESTDENLSTEDSQASASSSSDSQSLRRSRRSNTLSKASESEEKGENKRRYSRSNSKAVTPVGGRTRSSNGQEVHSKSSPHSTPENSQSLNVAGPTEVSQGRGRSSRRKSSQASVANLESSECESSEPKENLPMPKKRGRKPRASLQSPLTIISKEPEMNNDVVNECDVHQKADAQSIEHTNETNLDDSQTTPHFQGSESHQVPLSIEEQHKDSQTEVETVDSETTNESKPFSASPQKEEQREKDSKIIDTASQETETRDLQTAERLESNEVVQEKLPCSPFLLSGNDTLSPVVDATERLQSLEENPKEISESGSSGVEKQNGSDHQERPVSPVEHIDEVSHSTSFGDNPVQCSDATDGSPKEQKQSASTEEGIPPNQHTTDYITPLQDSNKDGETQAQKCQEDEEAKTTNTKNLDETLPDVDGASVLPESTRKDDVQGSPVKQKDLDTLMGPDFSQSPSSRTRGTWSPSASPSSSILKKGQKRALDDETPSPLVKVSDEADVGYIFICFDVAESNLFSPYSPGACLLLIQFNSRKLQMTLIVAALLSEPVHPEDPKIAISLSLRYD